MTYDRKLVRKNRYLRKVYRSRPKYISSGAIYKGYFKTKTRDMFLESSGEENEDWGDPDELSSQTFYGEWRG